MPEIIDPAVAELSPNLYNAARISGLDQASAKMLNQLSKQYKLGKQLIAMGDAKGRNEFLNLDPKVRQNIQAFFPEREMFADEKGAIRQFLEFVGKGAIAGPKLIASPIMKGLELLEGWEKTVKTAYPAARQAGEAREAERLGLPVTKRTDFSSGVLRDIYDGKNNWQWEKVAAYEERYGVALTTLARANAEGRTVEGAIDLYGNADEEMMAAVAFMYDKPEKFNEIRDALAVDAQISPGRDIVNDVLLSGKTVNGSYWANKALKFIGIDLSTKKGKKMALDIAGVNNLRQAETKLKEKISGPIDGFYTIFGDPLTYIGLGLPAVAKLATRGVAGIRVGVGEALKMSAFKSKGQRFAEQFKFVSERQGIESGYAWLFKEPEIKTLWDDQLGPRLKDFKEADTPVKKAGVLESIKFDFPEWYNEDTIKTLASNLETFDAAGAQKYFTHVDDANMMLNGRVNGISFRRNGIPYARRTRLATSAMHRIAYSVFNPSSEVDLTTKELLQQAEEKTEKAWTLITKVGTDENNLLNPEIDEIFSIQEDIKGARRLAYKLGVASTRIPGPVFFGEDAIKTADNIRSTASLVLPKNIANAVTMMLLDETLDVQLTAMRNMQYAYMKRLGLKEDDILNILQKTYNQEAGFTPVPDLPIADQFLEQMHPMAYTIQNGQGTLAASGAIEPSQLTKGIAQLPFDMIYQLSATAKLDKLNKATPAKNLIMAFNGFARSNFVRIWNNNWAAYTLVPRLGIRTNVDEGFFYYLTKPVTDLMDFVSTKFQKDIRGMEAVTGSSAAIGPWKGSAYYLANKFDLKINGKAFDPRQTLTAPERAELTEQIRAGLSKELGYEVPLSEVAPLVIKDTILSRIEEILKVDSEGWENWKRLFRHNSNFSDSLTASMGARDLAVGKFDRDFFDASFSVDQLALFVKEMGLEKSSQYTPREISKLSDREVGIAMWDNFLLRFGFNQVKLFEGRWLNPVNAFYDNNGLKTNIDFARARTNIMEQMGATYNDVTGLYDVLDEAPLKAALSNFGETVYFRQKGLSDAEIARIYSERMLQDMRFAFHGSADGFNQNFYDLMLKKHEEVVKAASRQKKPQVYSWSRAATNITWKEFDEATLGMRPVSGYVNTRLVSGGKVTDLDGLKQDLGTIEKVFEKFPDKALEMMDRQVTGFFRLPAMKVAIDKGFRDIKPFEANLAARHYKAIMENNPRIDPEVARQQAELIAEKTATNVVVNMATDAVLEFVDNPTIRSNFAMSIRHLGRFVRATEDFHRRIYRLYSNEGPRALLRMRLLNYGLENFGSVYEDENGDEYLVFPTDIVMNAATQKVVQKLTGDENFKVGAFNDFTLKFRLINPSFSPDAGQPAFAGPVAGLGVLVAKALLRDLPIVSAVLPADWEDKIYPWTNKAADYLDMFAMGHIGKNTDLGEALKVSMPMLASIGWETVKPAEKNKMKTNFVLQGISYLEAYGNGLPDNANAQEKKEYLYRLRVAADNLAWGQAMLGMISPGFPTLKDSKGLPEFMRDNGISTWSSAFWDIYNGVLKSDQEVSNPFEVALAAFIGSNPGKAVYTIPRNEKASRVFINKTDELKKWATDNKKFVDTYSESGIAYIFSPKIGEYNPDVYNWMESVGLVSQPDMKKYLEKVQIATDKEKYFAIGDSMNEKLANTADYSERRQIIALAERERQLILMSNPELEAALLETDSKGELNKMLRDIGSAALNPNSPMSDETRVSMQFAVDQVRSFIDFSDNMVNKRSYSFSSDRTKLKQNVLAILGELSFDPAVKEATRLIFVPLMNKYSRDAISASPERG